MRMNLSSRAIEVGAGNSVMALTFEGRGRIPTLDRGYRHSTGLDWGFGNLLRMAIAALCHTTLSLEILAYFIPWMVS